MSNATHTPGPWELGQNFSYETALVSSNGETVAYAAWDGGSGCHLEIKNPADAALIAAAPELLEALEAAEKLYLEGILFTDCKDIERVHQSRRAAIAKAKGGAA